MELQKVSPPPLEQSRYFLINQVDASGPPPATSRLLHDRVVVAAAVVGVGVGMGVVVGVGVRKFSKNAAEIPPKYCPQLKKTFCTIFFTN